LSDIVNKKKKMKKSEKRQLASWLCPFSVYDPVDYTKCSMVCTKGGSTMHMDKTVAVDATILPNGKFENNECTYTTKVAAVPSTPYSPGGTKCANPFELTPNCECHPSHPKYTDALCKSFLTDACSTHPEGPGCGPSCKSPDGAILNKNCVCSPCNSAFQRYRTVCSAYSKRAGVNPVTMCGQASIVHPDASSASSDPIPPINNTPKLEALPPEPKKSTDMSDQTIGVIIFSCCAIVGLLIMLVIVRNRR
jgi:hypothetical protein